MKTSKVVAFWSPFQGQTGQTLAVASAGSYIGINYNISTLLMHTHFTRSNLENVFLPSEKDIKSILFDEKGIDAVVKLARTKQLSDRSLTDYTTSLVPGRLEILAGTSKTGSEAFTRITETLPYIIACARKSFDLVLCDANPGSNSDITGIILENSDLVVVCLNQNLEVLKEFFKGHLLHPEIQNKKYIILLGNYHKDSIYTSGYIKRLFKYQNAVYTLPRCTGLMDAYNSHDILKHFFTNNDVKEPDNNNMVIHEVEKLASRIILELETDLGLLLNPVKKYSLIDILNIFPRKG
ncbi:MAG: hypothetical protein FIA99_04370 [Ruminiclostridium sp.]|nr:hypothetical protein [Ruminiclostridium sp.]